MIFATSTRLPQRSRVIGQPSSGGGTPIEAAANAALSWVQTETPKISAWVSEWVARVPARPTKSQAEALREEYNLARYSFANSKDVYVYNPHQAAWDQQSSYPELQDAKRTLTSAFANAFAPANDVVNRVLLPAIRGDDASFQAQIDADNAARATAQAAWDSWLSQSAVHFAALRAVYDAGRADPYGSDVASLSAQAVAHRDQLFALAHATLGAAPVPPYPWPKSKTLAGALESVQLAYAETDSQLRSNLKIRGYAAAVAAADAETSGAADVQPGGYSGDTSIYYRDTRPVQPPAAATIFGLSPIVALGLLALLLLVLKKRGTR